MQQTATTHSCLEPAEPHTRQALRPFLQIETLQGIGLATSSQNLDPFPMAATERPFLGGEWPKGTCLTSPIWHHDIMSVAKVMPSTVSSSRGLSPASLQGKPPGPEGKSGAPEGDGVMWCWRTQALAYPCLLPQVITEQGQLLIGSCLPSG